MATSSVAAAVKMTSYLLVFACILPAVLADQATTSTLSKVPGYFEKSQMSLSLAPVEGSAVAQYFPVVPLTEKAGLNQTEVALKTFNIGGTMVNINQTNYANITSQDIIPYISCDTKEDSSNITPNDVLNHVMDMSLPAIILYSTSGKCCSLSGNDLHYSSIYTVLGEDPAWSARNITDDATGTIQATISGKQTGGEAEWNGDNGGGNTSAVAMSILYSITGLITLLFLIIIATGAIRAHRHPERYGPRAGHGGQARQSRARGLARAMLETLPIVKFGDPAPAKGDPDQELESVSGDRRQDAADVDQPFPTAEETRSLADSRARDTVTSAVPATANAPSANENAAAENLGCSICTEDFTVGEDMRVLPCDHKFHPACVDPWLVNVSGTCPLCRLDLRGSGTEQYEGTNEGEAAQSVRDSRFIEDTMPPEEVNDVNTAQQRRRSRLLDWNRLRNAPVDERIQALRQFREQQDVIPRSGSPEDRSRRARLAERFRDKFLIRTRTRSPDIAPPAASPSSS